MKTPFRAFTVVLLCLLIIAPIFIFANQVKASPSGSGSFYVGVTYGEDSVAEAEALIDKVKNYTNLFVVDSWDISGAPNSTALDEICDYAVQANMSVMVYFYMIYYNVTITISNLYNSSTWGIYGISPWHVSWLNSTEERWGDKFLGVYLFDEPGGKQIDTGYWGGNNQTFSGSPVSTFQNVSTYDEAANRYVSSIQNNRGMQILSNTSYPDGLNYTIPAFTSDYALYWFDYKAGYNAVFTELGGNRTENGDIEQIGLCRGAADAQHKDWGAMITWASDNPPTPENGTKLLQDLTLAYNAGAKYEIVFNYQVNGSGGLTDDDFNALQQFWTKIHSSSANTAGQTMASVAYVLPNNYGSGLRTPDDKIWGLWNADSLSTQIWQNMNTLINQYGLKLDIIYDDPQVTTQGIYSQTYFWNSTINATTLSSTAAQSNASSIPQTSPSSTPQASSFTVVNATPSVAPSVTPSLTPSPKHLTSSAHANYLLPTAAAVVSIAALVCLSTYLITKTRKKRSLMFKFPEFPVKAKLIGLGVGSLKQTEDSLKFNLRKKPFSKRGQLTKDIELGQIDSLNQNDNRINVYRNAQIDTFVFRESVAPQVYSSIREGWLNRKKTLEKNAALEEQTQLAPIFTSLVETVDPLFDMLIGLQGEVNWDRVESCLKLCEESAKNAANPALAPPNLILINISSALKKHEPEEISKQVQFILDSLYQSISVLRSKNDSFNQLHPNYQDLKTAISAYYTLNDIMLGEAVGDSEVKKEKAALVDVLNQLSNQTNANLNHSLLAEGLRTLHVGEIEAEFAEIRALFQEQLRETLTPLNSLEKDKAT